MPLITKIATLFQSPGSTGGIALGAGDVNGHDFVECQPGIFGCNNGDISITKSGEWSGFVKPPGIVKSINLKFDWSWDMNLSTNIGTSPGTAGAFGLYEIDTSINNGGAWTAQVFSLHDVQNVDSFQNFNNAGSANLVIAPSTPINQIRVREHISGEAVVTLNDCSANANAQVNGRIQNIRLEIVFLVSGMPVFIS